MLKKRLPTLKGVIDEAGKCTHLKVGPLRTRTLEVAVELDSQAGFSRIDCLNEGLELFIRDFQKMFRFGIGPAAHFVLEG